MARLIYQPKGKAKEYCAWACNLYNGCSNKCEYCYNRHCPAAKLLGKDEPTIKGGMDLPAAFEVFSNELMRFRDRIIGDGEGLHFCFVSDPMIRETRDLNRMCIDLTVKSGVTVQVLTKQADWVDDTAWREILREIAQRGQQKLIRFGFTLTGMDELEPGASSNGARINAMKVLHDDLHFPTWASIEPVIDIAKSYDMISKAWFCCDEFRIGLLSGKKQYTRYDINKFIEEVDALNVSGTKKIILKDSVLKFLKAGR